MLLFTLGEDVDKTAEEFDRKERNMMYDRLRKLLSGEIESITYTDEEIKEKIEYLKKLEMIPAVEDGLIFKKRWDYEIKRNTELSSSFKKCPEFGFLRIEFIAKYGL